jgi:hypothetical protein
MCDEHETEHVIGGSSAQKRKREDLDGSADAKQDDTNENQKLFATLHDLLDRASHETLKATIGQMAAGNPDVAGVLVELIEHLEDDAIKDDLVGEFMEPHRYVKSIIAVSQEWKKDRAKIQEINLLLKRIEADIMNLTPRNAMTVLKTSTDALIDGMVAANRFEAQLFSTLDDIWLTLMASEKLEMPSDELKVWVTIFQEYGIPEVILANNTGSKRTAPCFPRTQNLLDGK